MASMAGTAISRRIGAERAAPPDVSWNRLDICDELMGVAERELAAFVEAVRRRFGSEEARQASEEWLEELACSDCFAREAIPNFRHLTIVAANRLARRVCTSRPRR